MTVTYLKIKYEVENLGNSSKVHGKFHKSLKEA